MRPSLQSNRRTNRSLLLMKNTAILLAALSLGFSALSAQSVPEFLNYQGTVTDSVGLGLGDDAPLNRKVLFRVYDAAIAGGLIWTEEQTVTISKGEFSVLLGQGIQFLSESHASLLEVFGEGSSDRYLEITVDNGDGALNASDLPIAPRQRITSTAYSFRAGTADAIASGSSLQLNTTDSGLGYFDANRTFGGFNISGPVLYGAGGGALGVDNGAGTQTTALRWNSSNQVGVGTVDLSGADLTSKLVLQGNDGTSPPKQLTIRGNTTTNRLYLGYNTTSNYGALQAYNGTSTTAKLLLNPIGSTVGVNTTNPTSGAALEINGRAEAKTFSLPATSSASVGTITQNGSSLMHSRGTNNIFVGGDAGNFTLDGFANTAIGSEALIANTIADRNTAVGYRALLDATTGGGNTAVGTDAGSITISGSNNTSVGYLSGPSSHQHSNSTSIGYQAQAEQSNMIRIGNRSVTVIQGQVGFTSSSDRNLKENFEPVDGAEVVRKILDMNLTSWNFIGHDQTKFRHYGPMAQDFFAAFGHDAVGIIGTETTINSNDLSGILLSAVQELARKLEVKDAELSAVQQRLAELEAKDAARDARLAAIEKLLSVK